MSVKTVHRWDEAGKLQTVRTVGNGRRIPLEEISRLRRFGRGEQGAERCALSARVPSVRQVARLQEAARVRGDEVGAVIREQASSLNEKRKGMKQLLGLIKEQAIEVILIASPDRLVRESNGSSSSGIELARRAAGSARSAPSSLNRLKNLCKTC